MQAALRTGVDPENHRQAKPSQGVYLMEHVNRTAVLVECGFYRMRRKPRFYRTKDTSSG